MSVYIRILQVRMFTRKACRPTRLAAALAVSHALLVAGPFIHAQTELPHPQAPFVLFEESEFLCQGLNKTAPFTIFIPEGKQPSGGWPLVILLHGMGRHHKSVIESPVLRGAVLKQKYAIVFPNGENNFYIDSPADKRSKFFSMLTELLAYVRENWPVSSSPKQTGVCGWSMGGFGAVYFAEHSQEALVVASSIGLLDYPNAALPPNENFPVVEVFGVNRDLWPRFNCVVNATSLMEKKILVIGGNSGMDMRMNLNFHERLEELQIPHEYIKFPGAHTWETVERTIPLMLEFMAKHLDPDSKKTYINPKIPDARRNKGANSETCLH